MATRFSASHDRPPKRGRNEAVQQFFTPKKSENFLKFHVMHCEKEGLSMRRLSPFLVAKVLTNELGGGYKVSKLGSGDLLLEVQDAAQCAKLTKITTVGDNPVSISPHRSMNTTRGVISDEDFLNLSEQELLEGFEGQNVVNVQRIKIRRDGKEISTKHVILTFSTSVLPESVEAGYVKIPVRLYIPNPRRCYKCQRFGHGSLSCRGKAACPKCSLPDHSSDTCEAPLHCVNCMGEHAAYSRLCPQWKKEKEIIALKYKENITFREARQRLFLTHTSFADVARRGAALHSVRVPLGTLPVRPQGTPQAPSVPVAKATAHATKEASRAAPAPLDANARPLAGTALPVPAERQAAATSQPSPADEASQEAMDTTPSPPLRGTPIGRGTSLDRSKQKTPRVTAPGKVS